MAVSDAYVRVNCEGFDCMEEEEIELTALARNAYDMRNVAAELKRMDWTIGDDFSVPLCPECSAPPD